MNTHTPSAHSGEQGKPSDFEMSASWLAYGQRSGLLNELGYATDVARAHTAMFAFSAGYRARELERSKALERKHEQSEPVGRFATLNASIRECFPNGIGATNGAAASGEQSTEQAGIAHSEGCAISDEVVRQAEKVWQSSVQEAMRTYANPNTDTVWMPAFRAVLQWYESAFPRGVGSGERMSNETREWLRGMAVSVDVSTDDATAEHRYFGTVTEVMDDSSKHGVILLVQDAKPNFAPSPIEQAGISDEVVQAAKKAFVSADPYFSPSGKSVRAMLEWYESAFPRGVGSGDAVIEYQKRESEVVLLAGEVPFDFVVPEDYELPIVDDAFALLRGDPQLREILLETFKRVGEIVALHESKFYEAVRLYLRNAEIDSHPAPEAQAEVEKPVEPVDKTVVGLYDKFLVERRDGSSEPGGKHDGCEYFVLDITHDPFALPALAAYAAACAERYPALAADLRTKLPEVVGHFATNDEWPGTLFLHTSGVEYVQKKEANKRIAEARLRPKPSASETSSSSTSLADAKDAERYRCPWCGGEAFEHYIRDGRQLSCKGCHASGAPQYHGPSDASQRARDAWNRRTPQPPPEAGSVGVLDELLAFLRVEATGGVMARIFFVLAPAVVFAALGSIIHPYVGLIFGLCVAGLGYQITEHRP